MGIFGRFCATFFVGNTVAWFTATRTFSMTAGRFTVAQVDGNLDVTLERGIGTSIASSGTAVVLDANARLVDSSVDLTGNAWRLNRDGDNTTRFASQGTPAAAWELFTRDSKTYYVAVSWTMTFKYEFATETADVGIYLDLKDSTYTPGTSADGIGTNEGGDSALGFRILFKNPTTAGLSTVFGNHAPELNSAATAWEASTNYTAGAEVQYNGETYSRIATGGTDETSFDSTKWNKTFKSSLALADQATNLEYVTGAASTATADYTTTNYVYHNGSYVPKNDGTGNTGAAERIATLTTSHKQEVITCVAWFEGTDPNVVNSTAMKYVDAALKFYARSDAA